MMLRRLHSLPALFAVLALALVVASIALVSCGSDDSEMSEVSGASGGPGPLKIGLLMDFSGGLAEFGVEMERGFQLALEHINQAGGVFGLPVEGVIADTQLDPTVATEEARRLVEVAGVHVIVGPIASAITLAVVESVTGEAGVPTISPSATSPQLSIANDDDFLFRTSLADSAQGPVLAQVTRDAGFERVGLLYRNDAWGLGLSEAFADAWDGGLIRVAIDPTQASYLSELQQSAAEGAEALVVVAFPNEAEVMIRESLEHGIYDQFTFGDGAKSLDLVQAIGGEFLGGMMGTSAAPAPETESSRIWDESFLEAYGELPVQSFVEETYDATIALALAAQAAGSTDGAAIRDQLRTIGSQPGVVVIAGAGGIELGLSALADGDDVDYEGAAVSLDWDERGDITEGYIGVWRYTAGESIEEVERIRIGD